MATIEILENGSIGDGDVIENYPYNLTTLEIKDNFKDVGIVDTPNHERKRNVKYLLNKNRNI